MAEKIEAESVVQPAEDLLLPDQHAKHEAMLGTFYGVFAAVAYTAANIALRQLASKHHGDFDWEIWVSCVKAAPSALVAWILIGYRGWRGLPALPPRKLVLPLLLTGLFMQFGGNVLFQRALSLGGLGVTIPTMFASLILGSALLGRIVLDEQITRRSLVAITILVVSIIALRAGSAEATVAVTGEASAMLSIAAMMVSCIAGVAYATCNVVIRRTVRENISLSATLVLLSTSGVVGLGVTSLMKTGPAVLLATPPADFMTMLLAGIFNAAAFFSLGAALKHLAVLRLNMLNASQIAMASIAGVLFFDEQMTGWLITGTVLTVAGLLLVDKPEKQKELN